MAKILLSLGAGACVVAAVCTPQLFWVAYLEAYLLFLGIALGCLLILLIHQIVGGGWGFHLQIFLLAGIKTLPWLLLLQLPLWLRVQQLYPWSHPIEPELVELVARKAWYLNEVFFHIRTAFFWFAWLGIAHLLRRQIENQQQVEKPETNRTLGSWSLIVCVFTISLAAIDWIMSLEPRFHSSIFGLIILAGFLLSSFAWIIIAQQAVDSAKNLPHRDVGNLLLMSVMLWAYGSYSQLLLIWSGQLPAEIIFYQSRFHPPWQGLGWGLMGLGFFLPFLLLLSRRNKKKSLTLGAIAGLAMLGHWLDLIWHIQPNFVGSWLVWLPLSLLTASTLGGIWILLFKSFLPKEVPDHAL